MSTSAGTEDVMLSDGAKMKIPTQYQGPYFFVLSLKEEHGKFLLLVVHGS